MFLLILTTLLLGGWAMPSGGPFPMKREETDKKYKEVIQVEATGEIVNIGSLYNIRNSKMYTAGNMFKKADLESKVKEVKCESSKFEVAQEHDVSKRAYLLSIDASLKLEFLNGLISVGGSANYLRDEVTNSDIARVVMSLSSTNKCKTIPITTPANDDVCELVKKSKTSGPTHVVTSLTTGLRSYFLYQRQTSSTKRVSELGGSLQVAIKSIPSFSIEASASVDVKGSLIQSMENVNVKFYGDALITNYPSEYADAYKSTEEVLNKAKESETAVRFQLTPIDYFCDAEAKVIADLNKQIKERAANALEELQHTLKDINALLVKPPSIRFGSLTAQLISLQVEVVALQTKTQTDISNIYPLIRSGIKSESELAAIVNDYEKSPFSRTKVQSLLYYLTRQINTLTQITSSTTAANGIKLSYSGSASDNDCIFNSKYSFVYTLHVLPKDGVIENYKEKEEVPDNDWFDDVQRVSIAGGLLNDFAKFATHNADSGNCFLIRMDDLKAKNPDTPDSEVGLFMNGIIDREISEMAAPAPTPRCHFSGYDEIKVSTEVSKNPVVEGHTVEAQRIYKNPNNETVNITESFTTGNDNTDIIKVTGLQPNLEYEIRTYYTLAGTLGKMAPSPWIKCKTAPTSTPIQVQILAATTDSLTATWQPPQQPSDAKNGLKYVVSAVEESGKKGSQVTVDTLSATLENLMSSSKYTIEVQPQKDGALSEAGTTVFATLPKAFQTIATESVSPTSADLLIGQEKVIPPSNGVKEDIVIEYSKMDSAGANIVNGSTVSRVVSISDQNAAVQYKLQNLFPGSKYIVRCKVRVRIGDTDRRVETAFSDGYILTTPADGSDTSVIKAELNDLIRNRDNKLKIIKHDKQAILDEMTAFQTKVQKLIKKVDDAQKGVQDAITKSQKLVAMGARQGCFKQGLQFYESSTQEYTDSNINDCIKRCKDKNTGCESVVWHQLEKKCELLKNRRGEEKYMSVQPRVTSVNKVCLEVSSAVESKWTSCTQSVVYSGGSSIATDITLEECVFTCADKAFCKGISYTLSSRKCVHKKNTISSSSSANHKSITLECLMSGS